MKILKDNQIIFSECVVASTFWQKLRGKFLINSPVLLLNCNSIHTLFSSQKFDILFLNKDNKVIRIYENFHAYRMVLPVLNANKVLELNAGNLKSAKIILGDTLVFEE